MRQGPEILRECSPPSMCHVSDVLCHMSLVTCHMSPVIYFLCIYIYLFKLASQSAEGVLSTGHTPSSLDIFNTQQQYLVQITLSRCHLLYLLSYIFNNIEKIHFSFIQFTGILSILLDVSILYLYFVILNIFYLYFVFLYILYFSCVSILFL